MAQRLLSQLAHVEVLTPTPLQSLDFYTSVLGLEESGREGRGVTVNAVAPGLTPTPGSRADMGPDDFAHVRAQQSIGRPLMPEDVAAAVSYPVSDDAAAVTGQALRVDGGLVTL